MWDQSCKMSCLLAGLLRLLLGLQHYRSHWGTNIQEDGSAHILERAEPGGLFKVLRYLRLQRRLDGQRLRLRGEQRPGVHRHLPVHLSGEDGSGASSPRPAASLHLLSCVSPNRTPSPVTMTANLRWRTLKTTGSYPKEMSRLWPMPWQLSAPSQWPSMPLTQASCSTAQVRLQFTERLKVTTLWATVVLLIINFLFDSS